MLIIKYLLVTLFMVAHANVDTQDNFLGKLEGQWSGTNASVPGSIELELKKTLVDGLPGYWILEGTYKKPHEAAQPLEFDITIAKLVIPSSTTPLYVMKLVNKRNGDTRRYSLVREINQNDERALFTTFDGEYTQQADVIYGSSTEFRFENDELVLSILESKGYQKTNTGLEYNSDGSGVIYRLKKETSQ